MMLLSLLSVTKGDLGALFWLYEADLINGSKGLRSGFSGLVRAGQCGIRKLRRKS